MFKDAPRSDLEKKMIVLSVLARSSKMIFPKDIRNQSGLDQYEVAHCLRQLRIEQLVILLENGTYTLSESGVEKATANKLLVHTSVKGRVEKYSRAGNVMETPARPKQPAKPKKPQKAPVAKTVPLETAEQPQAAEVDQVNPGSIADLFNTNELTNNGTSLLFRLLNSLKLKDLQDAGFTEQEVREFGDVYRFVKDRAETLEAE